MKVLVVVSRAVLGGHVLSAFTMAKYLKESGHSVIFAGGRGSYADVIADEISFIEVPIPIYHGGKNIENTDTGGSAGRREAYFTWRSIPVVSQLREIIKKHDFDLIHAFDARAYVHCCIAGLLEKKAVTCTLCGGIDPHYNLPTAQKIIVFSEEQRNKMLRLYKWKSDRVEVIRTRVDIKKIFQDDTRPRVTVELDFVIPTIMMISSFDNTKRESIRQVMDALELLVAKDVLFQMVFIGGKGTFWEEIKERAININRQCRREMFFFTGPVNDAYKLLKNAAIVLGVGRSAFEGMAFKKPTIIVGENGFAGIVSKQTIEAIAYYNFSGRNQKNLTSSEELSHAILSLLADSILAKVVGTEGRDFVFREIDIRGGLSRIEEVYKVNVENNNGRFRFIQWCSVFKIMFPILRDNLWHTIGVPVKRVLGLVK